jgi:ribose-phosphate pyrophosphokinase
MSDLPLTERCVLAWPGSQDCAQRIAHGLEARVVGVEHRRFPDAESLVRVLGDVQGLECTVVARLRDPDPQLPGLFLLADALRDLGAAGVGLAAPYLPYMRQDARFHPGEAIASRSLAAWISERFDWLVTVDPHLHRIGSLAHIYTIPTAVVPSAAAIAMWVHAHVQHPHIVGPDEESAQWVREVASLAGCGFTVLKKTRRGDRQVDIALPDLHALQGCTPVLVDDIISSGKTLAEVVRHLRAAGLQAPACVAVHALFANGAEQLLREAGAASVVSCNTLTHPTNAIDVTAAIAEALRALSEDRARLTAAQGPQARVPGGLLLPAARP